MKQLCLFVLLFLLAIPAREQTLPVAPLLPMKKEVKASQVITDLVVLHPAFRNKVILLIQECSRRGVEVRVSETLRDSVRQDSLYSKGKRVTRLKGGESRHQYGLAIDLYPVKRTKENWKTICIVAESLGLRSGYRWRHPYDPGHVEYRITTEALLAGNRPTIPDIVYIPI